MFRALAESWGKVLLAIALGIAVIMVLKHGVNPLEKTTPMDSSAPAAGTGAADGVESNREARPSIDDTEPKPSAGEHANGPMIEERAPAGKADGAAAPGNEAPPITEASPARGPPFDANARGIRIAAECWALRGSAPLDYTVTLDREIHTSGHASALIASRRDTKGYTTMFQGSDASPLRGRRVEFTADLRTSGAKGGANLLLRAEDMYGQTVAFDNMTTSYGADRRPDKLINTGVKGNTEWSTQHVVVDIPPEAAVITYGVSVFESGKVWIDNARIEVVGEEVPTTAIDIRQSPAPPSGFPVNPEALRRNPRNLEFDLEAKAGAAACN